MKHQQAHASTTKSIIPVKRPAKTSELDDGLINQQAHGTDAWREELIRQTAYYLFEKRGGEIGHDLDDWLQAETHVAQTTALPH